MATGPRLIYCADGNPSFARAAVEAGWLYGARLPATVYEAVYFADQHYRDPDREAYMRALSQHCPPMATVLDWQEPAQRDLVLSWAEEAAQYVTEAVVIIPKVPGTVAEIPALIGGNPVVVGYSVPTSYGASPLGLWEYAGRPVHLLGGSPQRQMEAYRYLRGICEVVSCDGNMAHQQAHRCRFWSSQRGPKGHWRQLSETGDVRPVGANLEAFRLSLANIREAWEAIHARKTPPPLATPADT